jgi:NitT/TauT family transport system ATP-binding protein
MNIEISGLSKSFGELVIFSDFSASFPGKSVNVLLGPSGCGKTSLLRMVAGLLPPDSGSILGADPERLSYVFQEPRLIPWLSVEENVSLAAADALPKPLTLERARHFLEVVGLSDFAQRKPRQLSGGMRQRASLARAFCRPADLLLMDEPFQSLDLKSRLSLLDGFIALWEEEPKTVVFVTHDVQEALYLGDSVRALSKAPARVLDSFGIAQGRGERDLSSPSLTELEHRLYRSILG